MNIAINLELDQEQADALAPVVAASAHKTPEAYLESIVLAAINGYVAAAYESSVRRLSDAVAGLSYAERQQIIKTIESQIK